MRRDGRKPARAIVRVLEVDVEDLSSGGAGVALGTVDGERRAIFVPGVLPGERVRVEADLARRPARGKLLEVLAPSPSRVAPSCAWVDRCGGCDWMHLAASEQAAAHARIVQAVLPSPFRGAEVTPHPAPLALGYRTRARVHVTSHRGQVHVGMFERASHDPVDVDTCVVLAPALDRARAALADLLAGASRGRGDALLSLGALTTEASARRAVLELRWSGELPAATYARLEAMVAREDGPLAGARVYGGDVRTPATIGDPTPWIRAADGAPLELAPGGFSQATEEGNVILAARARELADRLAPAAKTVELYAGAGNLTVLLAQGREVTAVELGREACEASRRNLARRGLQARVVEANATSFALPRDAKLLVLDPPRTGAREVAEQLAELARSRPRALPAVLYVSCDPPTLGRDLGVLAAAGYELVALETFEMFPQTSHVETIAALAPKSPARAASGG